MKLRLPLLFSLLGLVLGLAPAVSSAEADERIAAAYLIALGRAPGANELTNATASGSKSVSALVGTLRDSLATNTAEANAAAGKAFTDAFGREPKAGEAALKGIYSELVREHVRWLGAHPEEYAGVLSRAYQTVISRDVYPEEIEYWKKQGTMPYALLVACLDDWARRNQPGLMVTGGTATASVNCRYLTTARLSPAIAAEARAAAGLTAPGDGDPSANSGHNVIAVGGSQIVSSGRIHFVAAGATELVR